MCGINGLSIPDTKRILDMNSRISHRGPNATDSYVDTLCSLGHCRLSILDLSDAGKQPMKYTHNGRTRFIVFNGEIYNYVELKKELIAHGYSFSSTSDTEVLLACYDCFGAQCLSKLNGMWSFCIYDPHTKDFFCSVDRFGVKPFVYTQHNGVFAFSSELKALKPFVDTTTNEKALSLYMAMGYIPAPFTAFKHLHKLPAGHYGVYSFAKQTFTVNRYFVPTQYAPIYDKVALQTRTKELLYDATRIRMRSDVAVGAFLSGGLDSSSVVSTMRHFTDLSQLHTFSVGFEGSYDESQAITQAVQAFGTTHHHVYFTKDTYEELLHKYASVFDEPFADISLFPSYQVCQLAKKHVTVVLSGDGGDEMFGGYEPYMFIKRLSVFGFVPQIIRKLLAKLPAKHSFSIASLHGLKTASALSLVEPSQFYSTLYKDDPHKQGYYATWVEEQLRYCAQFTDEPAEVLRLFDCLFGTLQSNFLTKVDMTSMAHAIEVRSPYLDYRFFALSQTIPSEWKTSLFQTKVLLRDSLKGIVPDSLLSLKKKGFTPPIYDWVGGGYQAKYRIRSLLLERVMSGKYLFFSSFQFLLVSFL
jgi:asparagine synthase (glutamine-hydrolysing)